MKYFPVLAVLLLLQSAAKTQVIRDSYLIMAVVSADSTRGGYNYYRVRTASISDTPVCILYSTRCWLTSGTDTRLAKRAQSDSTEDFHLGYAENDTLMDHYLPDMANNPLVLAPFQAIDFSIAVPASRKKQYLNFNYVVAPNLCLGQMRKDYLAGKEWNRSYRKLKRRMQLKMVW